MVRVILALRFTQVTVGYALYLIILMSDLFDYIKTWMNGQKPIGYELSLSRGGRDISIRALYFLCVENHLARSLKSHQKVIFPTRSLVHRQT